MGNRHQGFFEEATSLDVWLVRDGDVGNVPDGDGRTDSGGVVLVFRSLSGKFTLSASQLQLADVEPLPGGTPSPDSAVDIAAAPATKRKKLGMAAFP